MAVNGAAGPPRGGLRPDPTRPEVWKQSCAVAVRALARPPGRGAPRRVPPAGAGPASGRTQRGRARLASGPAAHSCSEVQLGCGTASVWPAVGWRPAGGASLVGGSPQPPMRGTNGLSDDRWGRRGCVLTHCPEPGPQLFRGKAVCVCVCVCGLHCEKSDGATLPSRSDDHSGGVAERQEPGKAAERCFDRARPRARAAV